MKFYFFPYHILLSYFLLYNNHGFATATIYKTTSAKTASTINRVAHVTIDKCCPEGTVVEISDDFKGDWAFCTEITTLAASASAENKNDQLKYNSPSVSGSAVSSAVSAGGEFSWVPVFYKETSSFFSHAFTRTDTIQGRRILPQYVISEMYCKPFRVLTSYEGAPEEYFAQIRLLDTGEIWTKKKGNQIWEKLLKKDDDDFVDDFCIDGLIVSNSLDENIVSNNTFVNSENNQVILMCMNTVMQAKAATMRGTINILNFCLICLISIFPAITVIVYGSIWDQLNVHGWTKAGLSFCILVYALLLIVKIGDLISTGQSLIPLESPACIGLGVLIHFFCIGWYAWQTVLNYDIWATITAKTWKPDGNKGKTRFSVYCTIGFGIPAIVVGISLIIDNATGSLGDTVVRPQYGRFACSADPIAYFYYVLVIRKILFVFNVVFAFLVMRFMYRYKKESAFLKKFNFDNQGGRGSYNHGFLFFKLFALMGLSLLVEVLQFVIDRANHPTWYWAVLGAYNLIQPIFYFWIFVCNKDIKKKLCYKYEVCQEICDWIAEKKSAMQKTGEISSLTVEPSSPTRKHEESESL